MQSSSTVGLVRLVTRKQRALASSNQHGGLLRARSAPARRLHVGAASDVAARRSISRGTLESSARTTVAVDYARGLHTTRVKSESLSEVLASPPIDPSISSDDAAPTKKPRARVAASKLAPKISWIQSKSAPVLRELEPSKIWTVYAGDECALPDGTVVEALPTMTVGVVAVGSRPRELVESLLSSFHEWNEELGGPKLRDHMFSVMASSIKSAEREMDEPEPLELDELARAGMRQLGTAIEPRALVFVCVDDLSELRDSKTQGQLSKCDTLIEIRSEHETPIVTVVGGNPTEKHLNLTACFAGLDADSKRAKMIFDGLMPRNFESAALQVSNLGGCGLIVDIGRGELQEPIDKLTTALLTAAHDMHEFKSLSMCLPSTTERLKRHRLVDTNRLNREILPRFYAPYHRLVSAHSAASRPGSELRRDAIFGEYAKIMDAGLKVLPLTSSPRPSYLPPDVAYEPLLVAAEEKYVAMQVEDESDGSRLVDDDRAVKSKTAVLRRANRRYHVSLRGFWHEPEEGTAVDEEVVTTESKIKAIGELDHADDSSLKFPWTKAMRENPVSGRLLKGKFSLAMIDEETLDTKVLSKQSGSTMPTTKELSGTSRHVKIPWPVSLVRAQRELHPKLEEEPEEKSKKKIERAPATTKRRNPILHVDPETNEKVVCYPKLAFMWESRTVQAAPPFRSPSLEMTPALSDEDLESLSAELESVVRFGLEAKTPARVILASQGLMGSPDSTTSISTTGSDVDVTGEAYLRAKRRLIEWYNRRAAERHVLNETQPTFDGNGRILPLTTVVRLGDIRVPLEPVEVEKESAPREASTETGSETSPSDPPAAADSGAEEPAAPADAPSLASEPASTSDEASNAQEITRP